MKIVIVGGSATGPKVAARLRRLRPDAEITIVEQGDYISYGACGFPMYLGRMVPDFDELRSTTYGVVRDSDFFDAYKEVKVLTHTRALKIDRERKQVEIQALQNGERTALPYDFLILCTGAKPVMPNLPGNQLSGVYTMHSPSDVIALREDMVKNKLTKAVIIGAGLIGLEAADALAGGKRKIAICEYQKSVLPKLLDTDMAALVEQQMVKRGIDLRLGCTATEFQGDEQGRLAKVLTSTGEIEAEVAIIAVGVKPNTALAGDCGLELSPSGAIKVNRYLQTSDPAIYAAGDCVEHYHDLYGKPLYLPLASTANKQGRTIANNIAGYPEEFPAVYGTSVLQAFELNIGRTGLGEEEAKALGYEPVSVITTGLDSTHFYPMHSSITLKLIADEESGRLLGAQVCGQGEGIKRIDVVTTAIRFGATLKDVAGLDLGYAPPFATAIDPLIHAANALENKRQGQVRSLKPREVITQPPEKFLFIDVREQDEQEAKPIEGYPFLHIPLGELRERMHEIPHDVPLITLCELGIRGYEAACTLTHQGFSDVFYLEGGMSTWTCNNFHN